MNVKLLIDRPDGTYCFREKKDRVYYISERLLALAQTVKPDHLVAAGMFIVRLQLGTIEIIIKRI